MVNAFAAGKTRLVEPPYGSYVDTWQNPLNSNFGVINAAVSGTTTIDVFSIPTGSPFVTLVYETFDTNPTPWKNALAGQNLRIKFINALPANITCYLPAGIPGMWLIDNQATGNFTITIKTNATNSTGITPPSGYMSYVFCDGLDVFWADNGNVIANSPPPVPAGTIAAYGGADYVLINNLGWFACGGGTLNVADYPDLFEAIGYTWGGSGPTFLLPNLNNGTFLRGFGGNAGAIGTFQQDQLGAHTHEATSTDSGHIHQLKNTGPNANGGGDGWVVNPQGNLTPTETGYAQITTTIASTGGNETRPINAAIMWMIKY